MKYGHLSNVAFENFPGSLLQIAKLPGLFHDDILPISRAIPWFSELEGIDGTLLNENIS